MLLFPITSPNRSCIAELPTSKQPARIIHEINQPVKSINPSEPSFPSQEFIRQRQQREAEKARHISSTKEPVRRIARAVLRASGLSRLARKKALALQLERHALKFEKLPTALSGFRILHISDPHFPEQRDLELEKTIASLAANTEHDLTVLTGDYRDRSAGPFKGALEAMKSLRSALGCRAIAVLGNHDSIDMVEPLTRAGYEVLLNQAVTIEHNGAAFDVLGVDDPSYYQLHSLEACLTGCTTSQQLLLSHSPDLGVAAAKMGINAYLCGHTHGGQLCLPGGYPMYRNTRAPAYMVRGAWQEGYLHGYTSRGAGTSVVVARSYCPPELTLHTLCIA